MSVQCVLYVPLVHLHFLEQISSLPSYHSPYRTELHCIDEFGAVSTSAVDLRGEKGGTGGREGQEGGRDRRRGREEEG